MCSLKGLRVSVALSESHSTPVPPRKTICIQEGEPQSGTRGIQMEDCIEIHCVEMWNPNEYNIKCGQEGKEVVSGGQRLEIMMVFPRSILRRRNNPLDPLLGIISLLQQPCIIIWKQCFWSPISFIFMFNCMNNVHWTYVSLSVKL